MAQAQIIDGKAAASALRARVGEMVAHLRAAHKITPALAVVLVGDDPASAIYVRNKALAAEKLGIESQVYRLAADSSEAALLDRVAALNEDPAIHGILVQFPVPPHIAQAKIITHICPRKDVDGLHPTNSGRLAAGMDALAPCTPLGCVMLAKQALGSLAGVAAVIVGRSNLVGKPLAQLLLREHATVTIAHSRTKDLPALCRGADLLVAAVGRAEFVKGDWIKQGATVIDVGINRVPMEVEGAKDAPDAKVVPDAKTNKPKLVGDVAFAEALDRAAYITPVPGGVGPMTIACLMRNTLLAAARQNGLTATDFPDIDLSL